MPPDFDINNLVQPFVTSDETASVAEALTKLRQANREFILITRKDEESEEDLPVSIVRESGLVNLATDQQQKLIQLAKDLPPLLVLEEAELKEEDLSDVLTILGKQKSPGMVVRLKDHSIQVVPRASVARALPLQEIALVGVERGGGMFVDARTYVCRKCQPERLKRPSSGGPPNCDVWSHGLMELY